MTGDSLPELGGAPRLSARILVVGYGNAWRRDDAVGGVVAERVAAWRRPGLEALSLPLLTPELAVRLASVAEVIFVDAEGRPDVPGVRLQGLTGRGPPGGRWHGTDPVGLLELTRSAFGREPRAWLLTIPVESLDVGEGLTPRAAAGVRQALWKIARLWIAQASTVTGSPAWPARHRRAAKALRAAELGPMPNHLGGGPALTPPS